MEDEDGEHRGTDEAVDGGADNAASDGAGGAFDPIAHFNAQRDAAICAEFANYSTFSAYPGGVSYMGTPRYQGFGALPSVAVLLQHYANAVPSPHVEPEHGGVKLGEIGAWRCWGVAGPLLTSVSIGTIWEPGKPMEGDPGTGAGVHAWKTLPQAMSYYGSAGVVGKVALWGEVTEHADGYRAQYARITELFSCSAGPEVLHQLRLTYGLGDDGWQQKRFSVNLQGPMLLKIAFWLNITMALFNGALGLVGLWHWGHHP